MNKKRSSKEMASEAARIMQSKTSSAIQKELAGSVMSQRNPNHVTGKEMETKAAKVLNSDKYAESTKRLAGSVLAQADKQR